MNRLSENKEVTQPLLYDIASDFNNGWPDPPLIKYTHRGKVSRPLHLPWSSRFCFEFVSFGCAFTSLPIPPFLSSLTSITWSSPTWIPSQSLPTLLASGTDRHRRLRQPSALTHPAYFSTQQGVLKKDSQARSNRILTGWEFSFVFFFSSYFRGAASLGDHKDTKAPCLRFSPGTQHWGSMISSGQGAPHGGVLERPCKTKAVSPSSVSALAALDSR